MPRSRDFLERFRPAGTPGAAAKPGVPADRVAELSAELEPVLALLADTEKEADSIRTEASLQAERVRRHADERARVVVAAARRSADAERSDAAARLRQRAAQETAEILARAEQEAADVRRRGSERLPGYVDRVVGAVRDSLAGTPASVVPTTDTEAGGR